MILCNSCDTWTIDFLTPFRHKKVSTLSSLWLQRVWPIFCNHYKMKKMDDQAFSISFTWPIMAELLDNSEKAITTIKDDVRLSILRPKHLVTLKKTWEFLKSENWKSWSYQNFRFTKVQGTAQKAERKVVSSLDSYAWADCIGILLTTYLLTFIVRINEDFKAYLL